MKPSFIVFTLLFWIWFVLSGYFWKLSDQNDVFLPLLPVISWIIPGILWQKARWLFLILLILVPLLKLVLMRSVNAKWYRLLSRTALAGLIIFNAVSLVWGFLLLDLLYFS